MSKFMDTIMGMMGLDDLDETMEDAMETREEVEGEEDEPKRRLRMPRLSKAEKEPEETLPKMQSTRSSYSGYTKSYQSETPSSRARVVNMGGISQLNMVIVQPSDYSDGRDIVNHLKSRKPVIVNLEMLDKVMAKKVVDFLSGAVFALDGSMQKVSNGIIVAVPNNMNITGNIGEELRANLFEEFKL